MKGDGVSVIKVTLMKKVLEGNEDAAEANRQRMKDARIFSVDMMSSPGSGKTTILERTLDALVADLNIAVVQGDVYTTRDAERVEARGARAVQINTEGACHLDATVVGEALGDLDLSDTDILFVENVGNLICPAGFELGTDQRVMVLGVTEGSDKPEKYPAMFRRCSVVLVNKIDLLPVLGMDLADFTDAIRSVNPEIEILPVSALTGEGMEAWYQWLKDGLIARREE